MFKKINADPNEVDKKIEFAIRSTYFLFVRPEQAYTSFLEDARRFSLKENQKISEWWIKPKLLTENQLSIERSGSIDDDLKKNKFIEFFEADGEKHDDAQSENKEFEESGFYSAKENDYSRHMETQMDYFEDSDILIANESQYSLEKPAEEPERLHTEENKAQNIMQKQKQEVNSRNKILGWWNQKIVLIIELLDITTSVHILQSEKVIAAVFLIKLINPIESSYYQNHNGIHSI